MFNPEIRKCYDWADAGSDAMTGAKLGGTIGSVVPGVGSLIGAGAGALLGGITGLFQKKKGNQLLKQNPYPNMPVPNEVLANQQQAERMADEGTPSAQYLQTQKNIQQRQAAAIASAQDRRMAAPLIGAIQQESGNEQGQADAQSAMMRRENQLNLQNVNNNVASWRNKAWEWNQQNKYLQNYNYGMSLVGQGNANIFAGADKLIGGLTQGYANGLFGGGGRTGNNREAAAGSVVGSAVGDVAGSLFG